MTHWTHFVVEPRHRPYYTADDNLCPPLGHEHLTCRALDHIAVATAAPGQRKHVDSRFRCLAYSSTLRSDWDGPWQQRKRTRRNPKKRTEQGPVPLLHLRPNTHLSTSFCSCFSATSNQTPTCCILTVDLRSHRRSRQFCRPNCDCIAGC